MPAACCFPTYPTMPHIIIFLFWLAKLLASANVVQACNPTFRFCHESNEKHPGRHHGRRPRHPPPSAHAGALQTRCAARRQVPAGGYSHQQLPEQRHQPHFPAHTVQHRLTASPCAERLSLRSFWRWLRGHPRSRADAQERELVSGHGRRRAAQPHPFPHFSARSRVDPLW